MDGKRIQAMAFDYINQINPYPSGGVATGQYNDNRSGTSAVTLPNFSYAADDWAVIGSANQTTGTNTISGTGSGSYTGTAGAPGDVWERISAATGNSTDSITITVGATSRIAGTGFAVQSECNNN